MNNTAQIPVDADRQAASYRRTHKFVGFLLFLSVWVFYLAKVPAFSVPGRWAGIAVSFSGLDPFRPFMRPIWSGIVTTLASLPIANLGWAINLFTATTGALVCWLIYGIVRQIPYARTFRRKDFEDFERTPRLVAGCLAGLFAAVSLPLMTVSTWGDFAVLDMALMLLAFYFSMQYRTKRRIIHLYASFFTFGLAVAEYPFMASLSPGFLIWWAVLIWKKSRSTKPGPSALQLAVAVVFMVAGLSVVVAYAGIVAESRVADFRDLAGFSAVFQEFARNYYVEIVGSVPKVGWLLVAGMNILPFFFVMFRELESPVDKFGAAGVYAFRVVLVAIALITLFQLPGSPARMIGKQTMLLAPDLVVAVWFGFLLGYFYMVVSQWKKPLWRVLFLALCAAVFLLAGYRHAEATKVTHLAPVASFADRVVANLDRQEFILTDGGIDPSLRLALRQQGRRASIININAGQSPEYGRYHASMFIDPDRQNLATLGTRALIRGWLSRDTAITGTVAVLTNPDAVLIPGLVARPLGFFYTLDTETNRSDAAGLFEENMKHWTGWRMPDISGMEMGDTGWFQSKFVIQWLSRLANDLGVVLDDQNQPDLADEVYRQALAFWPDNLSATLNLIEQARAGDPEQVEILSEQLKLQVERNPSAFNLYYMKQFCGTVRNPVAMLEEAALLGRTGQAPAAMAKLGKISELIDENNASANLTMARLYLQGNNLAESEAMYKKLLEANPENLDAIYGLFEIAMARKNLDEAAPLLDQMERLGADAKRLLLERAQWNFAKGNLDEARRQLTEITRQPGAPTDAWYLLAQIAYQQKDEELLEVSLASLDRDRNYVPGLLLLAERAVTQKRLTEAVSYYKRVLALDPANEQTLVRLIQIDFGNRDAAELRLHTGALLSVYPEHPFGNFMSAYVHIDAGKLDRAEGALRRSLNQRDFGPARNELAYVLSELNRPEEALPHALRAVEMVPGNANFWDTLAGIQWKLGQKDEGLASMQKALDLSSEENPDLLLHAVQMNKDAGLTEKANEFIAVLLAMPDELDESHKAKLSELSGALKR